MNDTCVRTHLDVADFDCCDVHESAYRKGGFCLHCRIEELEAKLAVIAELVDDDMCDCHRIPDGGCPSKCLVCRLKAINGEE